MLGSSQCQQLPPDVVMRYSIIYDMLAPQKEPEYRDLTYAMTWSQALAIAADRFELVYLLSFLCP